VSAPLDDSAAPGDPALLAAGWVRRHLTDPERAEESAALYREAGFEVLVEPLKPKDISAACEHCAATLCRSYVLVYTRRG